MLVEYQPVMPSNRAFRPGATMVFISVCPVFKSLPVTAAPGLPRELQQSLRVDVQIRGRIRGTECLP